jgi:L-fuconolactonase
LIDAHQHFWSVARGDYGWMTPDMAVLYRDYGPDDLAPLLARHGIAATILVQAAQTLAETRYLLDIARRTPFVAGVVGWADLAAPHAPRVIATLASDTLLVGLRPMVQDLEDDEWLLRPELAPAIQALLAHGLTFDALVYPRHLSRLLAFLDRYPDLPVVLDHAGKPDIKHGRMDPWRADIAAIAARPRVHCKLSGLATEAADFWSANDLRPYAEHVLACFGPDRVMWGSDWPVVNRAGGYDSWRAASLELLATLDPAQMQSVLAGNASRFYLARRGRPVQAG